jgi:cell division protease FtsH
LRKRLFWSALALIAVALVAFFFLRSSSTPAPAAVAFSEFLLDVQSGRVTHVTVGSDSLEFERRDGGRFETVAPQGYVASNPTFVADLTARGVRLDVRRAETSRAGSYGALGLGILFFGFAGLGLYRVVTGRVPTLEKARTIDPQQVTVTFQDVAGVDEAKDEVREIVDFLKEPLRFASIGGRIPRGILLIGPPGTGKTLLARSMAGEAGVPFISTSGSDFVEMYAGVGASRVRRLFKEARRHPSCIVFIDELDAVGRNRGGNSLSHEEREQTLNQLLVEMDGFTQSENIIVVAATNRQDILDPALLRPGRFDRQVVVGLPDKSGREAVLNIHTRGLPLASDVDKTSLARGTTGFSGADLANLVNEAALTAARRNRKEITAADFEEALDKILLGTTRTGLMNPKEREVVAYHEAGHALVAHLTPAADPLRKVSIVPRGRALGVTVQMPEEDRHNYSRTFLLGRLAMLLGGRAAEMVVYDEVTTGAENDLKEASSLAKRMVGLWGMSSDIGPVYLGTGEEHVFLGREIVQDKAYSDSTANRIDTAVREMVEAALERAVALNSTHRDKLDALVNALLEHETLDGKEVVEILGPSGPIDVEAGIAPQQPATIEAAIAGNGNAAERAEEAAAVASDELAVVMSPASSEDPATG